MIWKNRLTNGLEGTSLKSLETHYITAKNCNSSLIQTTKCVLKPPVNYFTKCQCAACDSSENPVPCQLFKYNMVLPKNFNKQF